MRHHCEQESTHINCSLQLGRTFLYFFFFIVEVKKCKTCEVGKVASLFREGTWQSSYSVTLVMRCASRPESRGGEH